VVASAPPEVPPAPTAAKQPDPTPEPVASAGKPDGIPDVQFELDTALLPGSAKETLDEVVQKMKANSSLRLHVRGHSDQLGSYEHNVELSRRRAAAVVAYLLTHGVANARITTEAVGGTRPADPSNTPTAWARNRRVELEWR
jgi:outer membrane protein OmpA-like peptidoglycan-associated protein